MKKSKKIYSCDLRFNLESRESLDIEDLKGLIHDYGFKKVESVDEDDYSIVINAIATEEIINMFEEERFSIIEAYDDIEFIEVFKREKDTIPFYPHLKQYFNEGVWKSYIEVLEKESF